jgi:hypothetical protein
MKSPEYTSSPCGQTGSVGIDCDSGFTYSLCTYIRYGTVVYDTETQQPVTSVYYGSWIGLSPKNTPEIVAVAAEIPTNFYTGSVGLREYSYVILKDIAHSSAQANTLTMGGTGIDNDRYCLNIYDSFPGTAYIQNTITVKQVSSESLPASDTLNINQHTISFMDLPANQKTWPHEI